MEKKRFDELMTKWGWIPTPDLDTSMLASNAHNIDCKELYKGFCYCHKAEMTIVVDDAEISKTTEKGFEEWLEQSLHPYINSRVIQGYKWNRWKEAEGEYIEVWRKLGTNTKTVRFLEESLNNLQINRLTVKDDYVLYRPLKKEFSFSEMGMIYTMTFFKKKPE